MPIQHVKSNTIADGTNTDIIRPSDWNSVHAYTLVDGVSLSGNNTAGVMANISSGTLYLAGGNNITLSQNANSVTISQNPPYMSSYINMSGVSLTSTSCGQSTSQAVAFIMPENISFSFLRLPCNFVTGSTTLATTGNANMSAQIGTTWNAAIYSLGVGGNSRSLQYLTSGQGTWLMRNSISCAANSTQFSISQSFVGWAEGNTTSLSTQYSISQTNMPLSTTWLTAFTGPRFNDIPFVGSLSAGEYWLVLGNSSSSATNSAAFAGGTNCNIRYANHYCATQINSNFGIMGSSNLTSGGLLGAGSFSTAGGGTTNSLPISAISSFASNPMFYFQLLRSA